MQIHEITRKPLNEGPFLSGLYTGMQSALGKVGVQGPALAPPPNAKAGPAMNDIQASAMAVKQAQTLKPLMQKAWGQAVQKIMSTSKDSAGIPITSLNQLNPAEMDNLEAQLVGLINTNVGSRGSYTQLPNMTSDEQAKKGATEVVMMINAAKDAILKAAKDGTDAGPAWNNLMTGVGQAMTFQAFDTGSGGGVAGKPRLGTDADGNTIISINNGPFVKYDPKNNPEHKEINDKMLVGKL